VKYADVKDDINKLPEKITLANLDANNQFCVLLLRVLHAIAGELDSLSYAARKLSDQKKGRGRKR
jgi:hypothetical protein